MKPANKKLGERIRMLRQRKGIALETLALGEGLSTGTLSKIERGQVDPQFSTLMKIAEGLGIEMKELVDF